MGRIRSWMLHVSAPIDVLIMTSQTYVPHSLSEVISKCFRMVPSSDYKILSEIITKDSLSKIIMQLKCVRYLFHKIWEIKKKREQIYLLSSWVIQHTSLNHISQNHDAFHSSF